MLCCSPPVEAGLAFCLLMSTGPVRKVIYCYPGKNSTAGRTSSGVDTTNHIFYTLKLPKKCPLSVGTLTLCSPVFEQRTAENQDFLFGMFSLFLIMLQKVFDVQ